MNVDTGCQPAGHAALRTALMLGIFADWELGQSRDSDELAARTGAERILIGTLLHKFRLAGIYCDWRCVAL